MPRTNTLSRFLACLSLSMAACFGLQALVYYGLDGKTGKGESNYFSTLGRFQAASHPAAEIAFAGSSITGRLPGREVGNETIANLGSDGGPALDGIRMLVSGKIALPRWLVVETNTLYGGVGYGDSLMARNADSPWFAVGSKMPLLGASARPSAMAYSRLLRRPIVLTGVPYAVSVSSVDDVDVDLTAAERRRMQEYLEALEALQQKGVKILLVQMPAGPMNERDQKLLHMSVGQLQQRLRIPFLDLERQIGRESLQFTDAVHMAPEPAARMSHTVLQFCREFEKN